MGLGNPEWVPLHSGAMRLQQGSAAVLDINNAGVMALAGTSDVAGVGVTVPTGSYISLGGRAYIFTPAADCVSTLGFWESERALATDLAFVGWVKGDTMSRFFLRAGGKMEWGPGNATRDVFLERYAAGILGATNDFAVAQASTYVPGTIGAGRGIGMEASGRIGCTQGASTGIILRGAVTNDTAWRYDLDAKGLMRWTSGASSTVLATLGLVSSGLQLGTTGEKVGFLGATPIVRPTVTGSKVGGAALASLLAELVNLGLIVDGTSA